MAVEQGGLKEPALFLNEYRISDEDFRRSGLAWRTLEEIYRDHRQCTGELEAAADVVRRELQSSSFVCATSSRVKDAEHLVEKIVRKRLEALRRRERQVVVADPEPLPEYTVDSYRDLIHDLIGIRALHLFRDDWPDLHGLLARYTQYAAPEANIRKGDVTSVAAAFKENDWIVKESLHGYRSIHYVIRYAVGLRLHLVEIQVRTLFDEAWGEIDHSLRYPYEKDDPMLKEMMTLLNRSAGAADELAAGSKRLYIQAKKDRAALVDLRAENERLRAALERRGGLRDTEVAISEPDLSSLAERMLECPQIDASPIGLGRITEDLAERERRAAQETVERVKGFNRHVLRIDSRPDEEPRYSFTQAARFADRDSLTLAFHLGDKLGGAEALDRVDTIMQRFAPVWLLRRNGAWYLHGHILRHVVLAVAPFTWLETATLVVPVTSDAENTETVVTFTVDERYVEQGFINGFTMVAILISLPECELYRRHHLDIVAWWDRPDGTFIDYPDLRIVFALVRMGYLDEMRRLRHENRSTFDILAFELTEKGRRFNELRGGRNASIYERAYIVSHGHGDEIEVHLFVGPTRPTHADVEHLVGGPVNWDDIEISPSRELKYLRPQDLLLGRNPAHPV